MVEFTRGTCLFCDSKSMNLISGYCSPVCDSQHKIYGTKKIKREKQKEPRICEHCGKEYIWYQKRQRFCSAMCRSAKFNKEKTCLRKECTICQPFILK
jgi:hypothetical protein